MKRFGTNKKERRDVFLALFTPAIKQQTAATQEITHSVREAAFGTHDVSANIAAVSVAVDEEGGSSQKVLVAADDLATQSEQLRYEVNAFLSTVRAT